MSFLALDIATNVGWAQWTPGMTKPACGTWRLPGGTDELGRKACALHQHLADLHSLTEITRIYFEGGIPPSALGGYSNMTTIYVLAGLAAHAESFAHAVSARCRNVPNASWRKHFVGRGSRPKAMGATQFKNLSMVRCHELGWYPDSVDAADACGVLDYSLELAGIETPWRDRAVFGRAAG